MNNKPLPTRERLLERLRYDAKTGELYWIDAPEMSNRWRRRFVGKPAGAYSCNKDGTPKCIIVAIDYVSYKAHRIVWKMLYGNPVPDRIDHIDMNPFNNRASNMREANHSQNMQNRKVQRNNLCGIKGVTYVKVRSHLQTPWVAKININGRSTNLGYFQTKGLAAVAHAKAAMRYHGQFSYV
jgi:hypothetical protein